MENNVKEKFLEHIVQYPKEYSLCTGCHSCEIICGLVHEGVAGPDYGRIQVSLAPVNNLIHSVFPCEQCADHPCYNACPKKNEAMCIDEETGVVYIVQEKCIGCGLCAKSCKFTPSRIVFNKEVDRKKRKARKCDLCRGREGGPACIEHCPVRCIGLSSQPKPY